MDEISVFLTTNLKVYTILRKNLLFKQYIFKKPYKFLYKFFQVKCW